MSKFFWGNMTGNKSWHPDSYSACLLIQNKGLCHWAGCVCESHGLPVLSCTVGMLLIYTCGGCQSSNSGHKDLGRWQPAMNSLFLGRRGKQKFPIFCLSNGKMTWCGSRLLPTPYTPIPRTNGASLAWSAPLLTKWPYEEENHRTYSILLLENLWMTHWWDKVVV